MIHFMRIHVNDLSQVLFTHLYGPAMFSTIYVSPQLKEMKLGFVMQWEISSNLQPFKVSLRLLWAFFSILYQYLYY